MHKNDDALYEKKNEQKTTTTTTTKINFCFIFSCADRDIKIARERESSRLL